MPLDDVDRALLRLLATDGRMPNKALAERLGIAQSTCLARLRRLRERGVVRGIHADIDPRAVGHDLQVMIAVRLHPHARGHLSDFAGSMQRRPEVLAVYFVGGANDYQDFYCPTVEWDWGDDTRSESSADCDPYVAGTSEIRRRYTVEHRFTRAGSYKLYVRFKQRDREVGAGSTTITIRPGGPD